MARDPAPTPVALRVLGVVAVCAVVGGAFALHRLEEFNEKARRQSIEEAINHDQSRCLSSGVECEELVRRPLWNTVVVVADGRTFLGQLVPKSRRVPSELQQLATGGLVAVVDQDDVWLVGRGHVWRLSEPSQPVEK